MVKGGDDFYLNEVGYKGLITGHLSIFINAFYLNEVGYKDNRVSKGIHPDPPFYLNEVGYKGQTGSSFRSHP